MWVRGQQGKASFLLPSSKADSLSHSHFSLFFDSGKTYIYNVSYTIVIIVTHVVHCSHCSTAITTISRPFSSSQTDSYSVLILPHSLAPPLCFLSEGLTSPLACVSGVCGLCAPFAFGLFHLE